mgnify:CR=1 FL=1
MTAGNEGPPPAVPRPRSPGRFILWALLGIGALSFLALALLPKGKVVRTRSPRAHCQSNLRQIGLAANGYAEDFGGAFPPSLGELYPIYVCNARVFVCPKVDPGRWKGVSDGDVAARSDYAFVPGLAATMPGGFILAHDKSLENHDGEGRNVVFVDAHVEWWPAKREAEFERRLALQNEAVARWRASGRPAGDFGEFVSPELRKSMDPGPR